MRKRHKQVFLWVFLGIVALAMIAALIAIILPDKYISDELIGTIVVVGLYSLGGMIIVAISREMKWTTRLALISMGISMAAFIFLIWFEQYFRGQAEERIFNIASISLVLGFTFTHRLLIVPFQTHLYWGRISKRVALISASISAILIIFGLLNNGFYSWDDTIERLIAIALVFAAGTSLGAGAIAIFAPRPGEDEPDVIAKSLKVNLTCPVCDDSIQAMSNTAGHCGRCKLQIEIRTSELRCACGYLLHQVELDVCPECGKPIDAGQPWHPHPT